MRVLDESRTKWEIVCDQCNSPHVMTFVSSPTGNVELCWDCTKRFVPGWELELHHTTQSDHIEDAKARQWEKDLAVHTSLTPKGD